MADIKKALGGLLILALIVGTVGSLLYSALFINPGPAPFGDGPEIEGLR